MKKRIIFLTEGGQKYGLGHIVRCKALGDAFIESNCKVEYYISGDESISTLLHNSDYYLIDWYSSHFLESNIITKNVILVIDSYHANEDFYKTVSERAEMVICFDDMNRIQYPHKTFIINGVMHITPDFYRNQSKDSVLLLGLKYQCVRKEFWDIELPKIKKEIKNILITVGGNDIRNVIPSIKMICHKMFPESNVNIVIGASSNNIDEIKKLEYFDNTNVFVNPTINDLIKIFRASDISISAAGQTLCELACCGIPGISMSVIDNQLEHAKIWDSSGGFLFSGEWDQKDFWECLEQKLIELQDLNTRAVMSKKLKNLIDGKGAQRITELVLIKS